MIPDPLFKGARRTASVLGIPLLPFGVVTGAGVLVASGGAVVVGPIAYLAASAVVAPLLVACRLVADSDPHAFRLLWLRLLMRVQSPARTRRFWGGASVYAPVRLGRAR